MAEPDHFSTEEKFDVLIGRLIPIYGPDSAAALRRLRGCLRPGGIVALREMAMPFVRSIPAGPQFRQCRDWIMHTFARAGFELDICGKLLTTLLAARLPPPQTIVAGLVRSGPQSSACDYIAETVRSLLPTMERVGVADAAEVQVDTLAERLRKEVVERNACIMLPPIVGAWTRVDANPWGVVTRDGERCNRLVAESSRLALRA